MSEVIKKTNVRDRMKHPVVIETPLKMPKKRVAPPKAFGKGYDERRCTGSPDTTLTEALKRERQPLSIHRKVSEEQFNGATPPDATLRPKPDEDIWTLSDQSQSRNWIVDETKLMESMNDALQEHDARDQRIKGKSWGHTPKLVKLEQAHYGFGVRLRFKCGYKNCQFQSKVYELYEKTETGGSVLNLQAGVAMAKTDLTPTKVDLLAVALNLQSPSRVTLQKNYNKALTVAEDLADSAMADNREKVHSTLVAVLISQYKP